MKDEAGMEMDRDQQLAEEPTAVAADHSDVSEVEPEAEVEESSALNELTEELESLRDRHLRLAAEFDNYRRRVERERAEYRVRVQAELIVPLLDLLDDLQRVIGVEAGGATVESLLEGAQLIEKKFRSTLESQGLERIEAEGAHFDPATMEALMTVPAEDPEEDDQVADVFQQGYRFKDILIRPARVRVKKYDS